MFKYKRKQFVILCWAIFKTVDYMKLDFVFIRICRFLSAYRRDIPPQYFKNCVVFRKNPKIDWKYIGKIKNLDKLLEIRIK